MRNVRNRITQQQFFNLCTYLQENEGRLKGLPTKTIKSWIHSDVGIEPTRQQLQRAQESLGVDWIIRRTPREAGPHSDNDVKVVARALCGLLRNMGEEPDDDLADLAAD